MWHSRLSSAARLAFMALIGQTVLANAAELKIISGPATSAVLAELAPQFERETGYKLDEKGGVTGVLKKLIESGEPFDVAIIPASLMGSFAKQGKIAGDTEVPLARVGMGVAVRAGAPKPDISSVSAFKRALLNAKSITYVPTGEAATHLSKVLDQLGIADQMKAKSRPQNTVPLCIQAVANGDAEFYVSLTNIIASAKGIELAGSFPPELQHYLVISVGESAVTKEPKIAKALISLLTSEAAKRVMESKGLEPTAR